MPPTLLHYSDVENAYDDPDRIGRLAGCLLANRDEATLVCGTGDNTAPGVLSLVTDGRQALDLFEVVEPDFETFGNHDFDHELPATRDIVRESPQTWLSANAYLDGERFARDETRQWATAQADGEQVGFVGVTDPHTASINPHAEALTFTDPIPAVREATTALRERGVDHVVVLSHLGAGDEELAAECDVDVVLGGHVHSERVERIHDTLLTRPGANGGVVLEVELGAEPSVTRHAVEDAPRNDVVAGALEARMGEAGLHEVVATVEDPIERTEATAFRGESRIGNFVADAYRWVMDADVGLQNSGGIRAGDPLAGEVTVADLVSIVPFDEPVAVAEVTGRELERLCEQGSGALLSFGEPDWWHAHVSGARVVWDQSERAVESVEVGGEPVDPEETYTVATTDYLFYTDHEFPVLDESHRIATGDRQYNVLADYARSEGIDPAVEGRIVRRGRNA